MAPERIWHPISKLEFFIEHTRQWLAESKEAAELYEQARTKPQVLTDADVARIKKVYTDQASDILLFEEQSTVWGQSQLSPSRQAKLDQLNTQLAELRTLNSQVMELVAFLEGKTIEAIMAMSDAEVGLRTLAGGLPRPGAGRA